MSERKVLNKYYPPDFDPSKIPRMKLSRNRQYTVRLMAPFNMRCATCGEYIYKGKKFNARKEDVENEDYLGIRIYRFYIKCTRCLQEISFKTDPKNTDYEIEAGATRNFMALKLAEEQAKREEDELKEEEANNPMKLLENRTEQSRNEIELLESLEELKDLNRRQVAVDYEGMLQQYVGETAEERQKREEKEDEDFVKSIKFKNNSQTKIIISEEIIEDDNDTFKQPLMKKLKTEYSRVPEIENGNTTTYTMTTSSSSEPKPVNNVPVVPNVNKPSSKNESWNRSVGVISRKNGLTGLVKLNKKPNNISETVTSCNNVPTITNATTTSESKAVVNDKNDRSASVVQPSGGGLSLLSGYSDSDSNPDSD